MILNDAEILRLCETQGMIEPFERKLIRRSEAGERVISYGLSSFGYDLKVADEFKGR